MTARVNIYKAPEPVPQAMVSSRETMSIEFNPENSAKTYTQHIWCTILRAILHNWAQFIENVVKCQNVLKMCPFRPYVGLSHSISFPIIVWLRF